MPSVWHQSIHFYSIASFHWKLMRFEGGVVGGISNKSSVLFEFTKIRFRPRPAFIEALNDRIIIIILVLFQIKI